MRDLNPAGPSIQNQYALQHLIQILTKQSIIIERNMFHNFIRVHTIRNNLNHTRHFQVHYIKTKSRYLYQSMSKV